MERINVLKFADNKILRFMLSKDRYGLKCEIRKKGN